MRERKVERHSVCVSVFMRRCRSYAALPQLCGVAASGFAAVYVRVGGSSRYGVEVPLPKESAETEGRRWGSRGELREKGHGKGNRPRGGSGLRQAWYKERAKLLSQGVDAGRIDSIIGPCPPSAAEIWAKSGGQG